MLSMISISYRAFSFLDRIFDKKIIFFTNWIPYEKIIEKNFVLITLVINNGRH